jgi:hypothetical protein
MSSTVIPIVFIHIGGAPPDYARTAVRQARRWNPSAPIIIITSERPSELYGAEENWITIDTIPPTQEHILFQKTTALDTTFRNGFWRFTTERLFVLHDWMASTGITECLHLENDIMLYADISAILPTLRAAGTLAAPAHGADTMCFSIVYCGEPLSEFLFSLAAGYSFLDEMHKGAKFWEDNPDICVFLPVVPSSATLCASAVRARYENPAFPYVFDAAAHGQYLGGEDPRNGPRGPGFVNEDAEFRTDQFVYTWRKDAAERLYPLLIDKDGREWPIANLHIHSKRLQDFI